MPWISLNVKFESCFDGVSQMFWSLRSCQKYPWMFLGFNRYFGVNMSITGFQLNFLKLSWSTAAHVSHHGKVGCYRIVTACFPCCKTLKLQYLFTHVDMRSWSEATDSVIGMLLLLVRMSGPKQNDCCAKSPVWELLSALVILVTWQNFIIEISWVGVHLPEWWVTLHLYVKQCTYRCRETVAHAAFSPSTGWVSGF